MSFDQQTVMITGASGNLGRAVAQSFAQQGAQLVLVDLDTSAVQRDLAQPERHLFIDADLLHGDGAATATRQAVDRFGKIDVLCHLAGGFAMGDAVHETSPATWDFLLGLNAGSVMQMARAVVPPMLAAGGGKIVLVGANAAQKGAAHMGAYCASKSVVSRLTESMSAELRERHINVNCVLPSIIDTPQNRSAMPSADPSRWVSPAELANVILFLASPAAKAIHGASLPVTGLS